MNEPSWWKNRRRKEDYMRERERDWGKERGDALVDSKIGEGDSLGWVGRGDRGPVIILLPLVVRLVRRSPLRL